MALATFKPEIVTDKNTLKVVKPKDFRQYQQGTCEYVFLHGMYRHKRNRRFSATLSPIPSCTKTEIRDPALAFTVAGIIFRERVAYNLGIHRLGTQDFSSIDELFEWLSDFNTVASSPKVRDIRLKEEEEALLINALHGKLAVRNPDGSLESFLHLRVALSKPPEVDPSKPPESQAS